MMLSSCSAKTIFGVMLRWIMLWVWRYATANSSACRIFVPSSLHTHAFTVPLKLLGLLLCYNVSTILSNSHLPRYNSVTMWTDSASSCVSSRETILWY